MSTMLSACVLLRGAPDALPACLGSLDGVCDDIVVVVTGECAGAGAVLAALDPGIRVAFVPWTGDEGALWRAACARAVGRSVLLLDAREQLVVVDAERFRRDLQVFAALALPRVEADRAEPDVQRVLDGEGRLSDVALASRVVRFEDSVCWWGGRAPRLEGIAPSEPTESAWIVSTCWARSGQSDPQRELEEWVRAVVAEPSDAALLGQASRALRTLGHEGMARELAERACRLVLPGQVTALHTCVVAAALCDLDGGDAITALDRVRSARERGAHHPDLDLVEALACIEVDSVDRLEEGREAARRALAAKGQRFEQTPLPGATGDAAELALVTLHLALGDLEEARKSFARLSAVALASLPARLHEAELELRRGRPATALRLLVDRLEHAGADGWILAAEAASMLGQNADRIAFLDRAEAHLDAGLLAPHRRRRLAALRGRLAADAVRERLAGEAPRRSESVDPVGEAETRAQQGDLEEAHILLIEALRRDPIDVVAWVDLGVVLHEGGAPDAAALALRVAVELRPDDADLRVQLAYVTHAAGRLHDAVSQARAALQVAELADARALLAALDVEGAPAPLVALQDPNDADAIAAVRAFGARPVLAYPEVVQGLGGPLAWLERVQPDVVLEVGPVNLATLQARIAAASRDVHRDHPTLMSVVVVVRNDLHDLIDVLDRLALQDFPPSWLEVIVVDDGSSSPVRRARLGARPFSVRLLRQRALGRAAARNAAIEVANSDIIWFLDPSARPDPAAARMHWASHQDVDEPVAIVGGFSVMERHRRSAWDHLIAETPLGRGRPDVPLGGTLPWQAFHTCNTSLSRSALLDAGGFDAVVFQEASHDEAELGYRLACAGMDLQHRPDIHAGEDRRLGLRAWIDACERGGRGRAALVRKFPELREVFQLVEPGRPEGPTMDALRTLAERDAVQEPGLVRSLSRLASSPLPVDSDARRELLTQTWKVACAVGERAQRRGLVGSPHPVRDPRLGLVSVVLVHRPDVDGAADRLQRLLEGLRQNTVGPVECVIVWPGGSAPPVGRMPDVIFVPVDGATSDVEGFSVGMAHATGDTVFCCDDGIRFAPGWRPRLLNHMAAWPNIGIVTALGARSSADLERIADDYAATHAGEHAWPLKVPLHRCLIRRELIAKIGAPDPALGALAGLDLSLRARRAGFRVRLAADVLLGSHEVSHVPTVDEVRAFRARHGVDPVLRSELLESAERELDPERDVVPLAALGGRPRLLQPWLVAPAGPQGAQDQRVETVTQQPLTLTGLLGG